jgi:hypothetical protein
MYLQPVGYRRVGDGRRMKTRGGSVISAGRLEG